MIGNTIDNTVGILQVLTDKLSGINDKAKENALLSSEYEDLNNKLNKLNNKYFFYLVKEGILSKPISKFTNKDIGTIVSIPYTDESGKISLNNGCIEFEVVGVNHHKDINYPDKPTITLMTKNILRQAAFDAKEPTNTNSIRAAQGNNRWSVSNIRQWLNSDGEANEWFTAQHEYDAPPDTTNVEYNDAGAYADEPGFLAGFSDGIKSHFATVANITQVYATSTSEITNDKVFLASFTEMFGINSYGIAEGTHLSIRYPNDYSRIKSGADGYYWLRSDYSVDLSSVRNVGDDGYHYGSSAFNGTRGLAPLVVLI